MLAGSEEGRRTPSEDLARATVNWQGGETATARPLAKWPGTAPGSEGHRGQEPGRGSDPPGWSWWPEATGS